MAEQRAASTGTPGLSGDPAVPSATDRADHADRTLEGAEGAAARTFLDFLASIRPAVEARLEQRWQAEVSRVARYGREVEAMATEARSLTLRGGKRYRAGLVVAAHLGLAPDAPLDAAYDVAAALELIQTYLLIQDDWIDEDPTRRGGPSVHTALGHTLGDARLGAVSALLSSDLTWSLAIGTLAHAPATPERIVATLRALCDIHQDVVVGQHLDVLGRAEDVEQMHALKTGSYTVRGPLVLGATLAGASADVLAALDRFAAPVGIAFQLRDDLLGTFGSEAETGKPVGNDLRAGKRTAVIAWADGRLDAAASEALRKAFGRSDATANEVAAATAALVASGARTAVEDRLDALCAEAEALAASLPVSPRAREILAGAAAALRWRQR
ncbi:polyprenyl synthetase family protein [Chondromyces apiculatus]|uniref:Octaprenyl diphosphate synthase n=1 Tax=Chondromyces apiculatus DSM 436 TaxID=1192034 RepID=A0A017T199_9BACT|nr:polyprenyl synthetase family protein [Chondromyces apiculatus]EYF02777.1 Octaprenyl diphosphate synthase [Chondromyces apiculatus DSM 436]